MRTSWRAPGSSSKYSPRNGTIFTGGLSGLTTGATGMGGPPVVIYFLAGTDAAASIRATLFYQAIPPFYLQDRFCTATGDDTQRLQFLAGHLNLDGTQAQHWKLMITDATAAVPR